MKDTIFLVAGIIAFISAFYFIITEKLPSTYATMGAGLLMALIGILNEEDMLEAISGRLEVIFLLVAMIFNMIFKGLSSLSCSIQRTNEKWFPSVRWINDA